MDALFNNLALLVSGWVALLVYDEALLIFVAGGSNEGPVLCCRDSSTVVKSIGKLTNLTHLQIRCGVHCVPRVDMIGLCGMRML